MLKFLRELFGGSSKHSTPSLGRFFKKIKHLSRPEYPFLHPSSSSSSRTPCADLTPFIVDRLREQDIESVQLLMRSVIAENVGQGTGPELIAKSVKQISNIDFGQYCSCSSPDFIDELKALFIVAAKDGGKRTFLVTDSIPIYFSYVLSCYDIEWSNELKKLRKKANSFIRKKKANTPFWKNYPLFSDSEDGPFPKDLQVTAKIAGLTPMARLHLLSFAERGTASLMKGTPNKMRSLGLNPLETAPAIIESGICELIADFEVVKDIYARNDLITLLEEKGIDFKKSWKKGQLLEAIVAHDSAFIDQVSEREKIVRIKAEYKDELDSMLAYANSMQKNMELLCFA